MSYNNNDRSADLQKSFDTQADATQKQQKEAFAFGGS